MIKHWCFVLVFVCGLVGTSFAQNGTVMPVPRQTFLDNNGNPVSLGTLTVYDAGTLNIADVYTTSALSVLITNPIQLNAAGRPTAAGTETGVFLTPGQTFDFVLRNALGSVIYSQSGVAAVPLSASALDTTVTFGEDVTANDVVYMSDGSGGKNASQWYKADADFTYASSQAPAVGVVPSTVASGAMGIVRQAGLVDLAGLSPGVSYYISATPGALTSTAPTNARFMGAADSATKFLVGSSFTLLPKLIVSSTAADSIDTAGGINAGTLNVGIVDTTGKIPALNTTYLASVSGQSLTGIGVLLTGAGCSSNGSTTTAGAETLATCAITGLTQNDTIRVVYTAQAVTQQTAGVFLFNGTDTVQLTDLSDNAGVGAMLAGINVIGEAVLRRSQDSDTSVYSYTDAHTTANNEVDTGQVAAVVTGYTGTWNLTYTKGATTAGGTLRWAWTVYVQRGQ